MTPKKIVLLLSGGLDSVTLLYETQDQGHHIYPLLINYGQAHTWELVCAQNACRRFDLPWAALQIHATHWEGPETFSLTQAFPALFLQIGACYAHALHIPVVYFAANQDDAESLPSCSLDSIAAHNRVFAESHIPVRIVAPYLFLTKAQVARRSRLFGIADDSTYSCLRGGQYPCQMCVGCQQRQAAFHGADFQVL